jgi:hypothetical protein
MGRTDVLNIRCSVQKDLITVSETIFLVCNSYFIYRHYIFGVTRLSFCDLQNMSFGPGLGV